MCKILTCQRYPHLSAKLEIFLVFFRNKNRRLTVVYFPSIYFPSHRRNISFFKIPRDVPEEKYKNFLSLTPCLMISTNTRTKSRRLHSGSTYYMAGVARCNVSVICLSLSKRIPDKEVRAVPSALPPRSRRLFTRPVIQALLGKRLDICMTNDRLWCFTMNGMARPGAVYTFTIIHLAGIVGTV